MLLKLSSPKAASMAVFISAAFWGVYWIPLRYLEQQGVAGTSAVALLSMPALLPLIIVVGIRWKLLRGYWGRALLIGLFTGLGIALYSCGVIYSSVVRATLFFYLTPVWATMIEIVWLKEKADWPRWLAIVGGLSGMTLLLSGNGSELLNIGDLMAFLSGIFWAMGAAMIKRFDNVPLAGMALCQFTVTVLAALIIGYVVSAVDLLTMQQVVLVLPIVSLVSIVAILPIILTIIWAQKFINPGRVGLLMMSEVLVAVISASLLLPDERMTFIEWGGAVLIIGSCLIEVLATPKPQQKLLLDQSCHAAL